MAAKMQLQNEIALLHIISVHIMATMMNMIASKKTVNIMGIGPTV